MTNLKGKELDEFFRKELSGREQPFEEYHWLVLEKRLKKSRRNRVIGWVVATGLAAMLLVALGITFLWNQKTEPVQTVKARKEQPKSNKGTTAEVRPATKDAESEITGANSLVRNQKPGSKRGTAANSEMKDLGDSLFVITSQLQQVSVLNKPVDIFDAQIQTRPLVEIPIPIEKRSEEGPAAPEKTKFKPSLSLGVFGGPDINGVNNLKNSDNGLSGGLSLTYAVAPRLSITAGVAYAKKLYSTDFANYKPNSNYKFPTPPSIVDADCRVLDLPVNVNYTVWNKKSNSIEVSAGMSSYLMLREEYYYNYDYGSYGPRKYEIKNRNKHYLGVINLGVGYRKDLNKNLSIGVNPYFKLPVTDIGYGNVKLESAGITTSLNFNLRGLKPNRE